MAAEYMEKESCKKKYLAPLVVIMLCLVAITGAAYAYSTTVTGNGDINGKYVVLDMYEDKGAESAHNYEAVADLDVVTGAFTVTTDRTVITDAGTNADKLQYVANVVEGELRYSTILHINTNDTTANTFYLTDPEFEYKAPTSTETVTPGTLTLGDLKVISVTGSSSGTISPGGGSESEYFVLNADEYYTIVFTIAITTGEFGTYDSLSDLEASLGLFDAKSNELAVTFTASDAAPTI